MSEFGNVDDAIRQALQTAGSHRMVQCRHCDCSIYFVDRIAYGEDDREHRCLTTAAQKRYQCFHCNAPINFQDRRPINADGSAHRCRTRPQARPPQALPSHINPDTGEITEPGLF